MGRLKSTISNIRIDSAGKAHNCRHNPKQHRLQKGDHRLLVKEGRKSSYYCLECAIRIVQRDIEILREFERELLALSEEE